MAHTSPSAALAPEPQRVRRGRRGSTLAVFVLPLLAVTGVLTVAWTTGLGDPCGGPVPGCGSLRNAGDTPVTVRAVTDPSDTEMVVAAGERVLLGGTVNEVRVEAGHCLIVEGGPFWDARTVIDQTVSASGSWHPIDDWGARVYAVPGDCPDRR
jgi:hypothetical protein